MPRKTQTRWLRQRGQSLLETAMMIVVMFTVVFWVFEVGWFMYTYTVLADAANEGVRYAIVHTAGSGCLSNTGGTQTTVANFAALSLHNVSALTTSVTFPDGSCTGSTTSSTALPSRVRVTVSYQYVPYLPQIFTALLTMNTYAEGRMVVQ